MGFDGCSATFSGSSVTEPLRTVSLVIQKTIKKKQQTCGQSLMQKQAVEAPGLQGYRGFFFLSSVELVS